MNRSVATLVGVTGFLALLAAGYFWFIPAIEQDLTEKSEQELAAAGIDLSKDGATVDFDGRIGTVTGVEAEAGLSAVRNDVDGATWNRAEVIEVAPPPPPPVPEPSIKMTRVDANTVSFDGVVGSEKEKAELIEKAIELEEAGPEAVGPDVIDNLAVDPQIERDTSDAQALVGRLLVGSDDGEFILDGDTIEITATALDPVEDELLREAVDQIEDDGWVVKRDLDVIVLPEAVQITKLSAEIEQIFRLAREIEDEEPNFGSSDQELNSGATGTLDRVIVALRRYPLPVAEIIGHTDSIGDAANNQVLSEERAAAVAQYLVDNGISEDRLTASGRGETEPLEGADNSTEEGRAANRRVNFVVGKSGD